MRQGVDMNTERTAMSRQEGTAMSTSGTDRQTRPKRPKHRKPIYAAVLVILTVLMVLALSSVALAAVAHGRDATSNTADDVASITVTHTAGTGTDRLMLVGVSWNCESD